jgi:hypothetical protein
VVDGRSYKVPDQGACSTHPYQAGSGHSHPNLFAESVQC